METAHDLILTAVALAIFNVSTVVVQAEDYTYTTNEATITITRYTGSGGAVVIPDTINGLPVTSIGSGAFDGCASLSSVTIPGSVTSIRDWAFIRCTRLTNLTMPNSVASIGDFAFYGCTSLTSVTIPNSVTSIGVGAFGECNSLTAVDVNAQNPAYAGVQGLLFNKNLTTLIQYPAGKAGNFAIPNTVTSIGNYAVSGCNQLTSITIPQNVTSVGDWSFAGCRNLTSVTISDGVTDIAEGAFGECNSLKAVTIPDGVTSIEASAFTHCALTNVTIPNTVTNIGGGAFNGCALTSVTIPNSVTSIGESAFGSCSSLTAIEVGAQNSTYASLEGVLFNKNLTTLIQCPLAKAGIYTVPNSVTSIGDYAFMDCWSLTNVTIPNSVSSIGYLAFTYSSLTAAHFQGDCPILAPLTFACADHLILYYLPGTAGWSPIIGEKPALPWFLPSPMILDFGPSFGVVTNQFGFRISWATNVPVVVEASTTLANPGWFSLSTNTLTDGWTYFSDAEWTNYTARFYRVRQR